MCSFLLPHVAIYNIHSLYISNEGKSMQEQVVSAKHQTQASFQQSNMDFKPPQHSYIASEQFSSAFFRDHNEEEYQIQRAFKATNFTSLRANIPNQLRHGAILDDRLNRVQDSVETEAYNRRKTPSEKEQERNTRISKRKTQQIGQLGYFEIFPYQESQYDIEHDLKLKQMYDAKRKQQSISAIDFRPSGFERKMKYENPFSYADRLDSESPLYKEEYLFPFHVPDDTYDQFHYSELRQRIIQEGAKLAGDFIPASNQKSLTKVNRSKASEILKELEEYLKRYLTDTGFFIGMNRRDHIDILFEQKEADNSRLNLVMSRLCEHQTLSKYILKRNISKWGRVGQNGYLEYCVLPPWVKEPQEKLSRQ